MDITQDQRELDDLSRVTWPQLHCREGDTLVIVNFQPHGARNCQQVLWTRAQLRMSSELLLSTGSAVLANLFAEDKQRRFRLRYRDETFPADVLYLIDLTPSMEGDDMASLLGKLSLPDSVRKWWMSMSRLGVSSLLVSGHDDDCRDHQSMPVKCASSVSEPNTESSNMVGRPGKHWITFGLDAVVDSPAREIRDYCEIRHRANIIRLLLAVAGYDLVLNSAPRVYTIIVLAEELGLINLVSSPVRAWLQDQSNSSFIDIYPETALEMAWRLQLSDLVRAPLRVLVVERALEPAGGPLAQITMFGRPRISLSDDVSTVVQHATNSVRIRTSEAAAHLFSMNPYSWFNLPAWATLTQIGDIINAGISAMDSHPYAPLARDIRDHYYRILVILVDYIKTAVDLSSTAIPEPARRFEIDNDRLAYLKEGLGASAIITRMSKEQTLLTPFFWTTLMDETVERSTFLNWRAPNQGSLKFLGNEMVDFGARINKARADGLFPGLSARFPNGLELDPTEFHSQLSAETHKAWRNWAPFDSELEIPLSRSTHLALGFGEDEFKFLPLWAGGLDDGTGAVFGDMTVPDTDMGPCQPGPAYVTGKTIAPSSAADSDMTIVGGGLSVQAARSGTESGVSRSETMESFDEILTPSSSVSHEDFGVVHGDATSLEDTMEDLGIFSDFSQNGNDDHLSRPTIDDDVESVAADSGDLVTDSDRMSCDSDWSNIYD